MGLALGGIMKNKQIVIWGTGLMGAGIAALLVYHGYQALMIGRTEAGCTSGAASVRRNLEDYQVNGLINPLQVGQCMNRLFTSADTQIAAGRDLHFEAVQEIVAKKQAVYETIESITQPNAVIMSMTSSLSPDLLSEQMRHPERFIVAHPWNPPHLVPCVEVVKGTRTSEDALQSSVALLTDLDREIVVLQHSIEGFIGNRIQHAMYREALNILESGVATAEEIDRTILSSIGQRFSMVGLLEYYDSCGLDLQYQVQSYLFPSLCNSTTPQETLMKHYKAGELGLKTGKGLFDWSKKDVEDFRRRKSQAFYKFIKSYQESAD